jgi:hypothetical protein
MISGRTVSESEVRVSSVGRKDVDERIRLQGPLDQCRSDSVLLPDGSYY